MTFRNLIGWLKEYWRYLAVVAIIFVSIVWTILYWWASYQCVEAGFLGGTIHNFRVVCFVLWR